MGTADLRFMSCLVSFRVRIQLSESTMCFVCFLAFEHVWLLRTICLREPPVNNCWYLCRVIKRVEFMQAEGETKHRKAHVGVTVYSLCP